MAKERGRHDHARVIAAAEDLEVGSAGERRAHADDQLAGAASGTGTLLDADIFAAVEDRGLHGAAAVRNACSTVLRPRLTADSTAGGL
jgi:hypothetical protein